MHFFKEPIDFNPDCLELDYFSEKPVLQCKDTKSDIESVLGLLVTNMVTDADQKSKKASLRNMVSYMFQHQNLMASKFALFYRFSDFYKRKDIIDQFPVFAGMISQEYYSDLIQLNKLKSDLKQLYKKQKANEKEHAGEIRAAFIARLKKKELSLPDDSKYMGDVEALALLSQEIALGYTAVREDELVCSGSADTHLVLLGSEGESGCSLLHYEG